MKIGILGYGNLGKGVEAAIKQNPDCELTAIFTRRDPASVKILTAGVPVYNVSDVEKYGAIKINNEKKRTRYKYDIDSFVNESHL